MAESQLRYSIRKLLEAESKGSYQTQNKRQIELLQMAHDLYASGYKLEHVKGLKPKHIQCLNELWKQRKLSAGTIKNKNTQLRWWAEHIGKASMMPSNDELGVPKRMYVTNENKGVELPNDTAFLDPLMNVYLSLQRHLGLRRQEAIKLKPYLADKGTHLELQGSWCKGGRPRSIPILTNEARAAVDAAKQFATNKAASLIPAEKTYIQQLYYYKNQLAKHGIKHGHGLRHSYVQDRYKALTGWECPVRSGLTSKELTPEQKQMDEMARNEISANVGHCRKAITAIYCGR